MNIAIADVSYAGLSLAVWPEQNNQVTLADTIHKKVKMINSGCLAIADKKIEKVLAKGKKFEFL